jgi:polysaccharide export outer membrane protein
MKIKLLQILSFGLTVLLLYSCIPNKKMIYMQEMEESMGPLVSSSQKYPYQSEVYLLQINDIVEVNIKTTDEAINRVFSSISNDPSNQNQMGGGGGGAGDIFFMNGYTLDDRGEIEIPLIGKVKFEGLTTEEAKILIEKEVRTYVNENEYFVRVRLGGIRFSTLGEFNQSGKYTVLQNRVTIYEAIALAGDLSRVAKRDEILLIRQYPDGTQIHKINLLDRDLLTSEFYWLKPNDMIYAEPMKVKEIGAGSTLVETLTLFTTSVTAVALILTLVKN